MKRATLLKSILPASDDNYARISDIATGCDSIRVFELELMDLRNKVNAYLDRLRCLRLDEEIKLTDK